jgi:DNA-binding response OmpR family regulator
MNLLQQDVDDLIVVDPSADDYDPIVAAAAREGLCAAFFSTGEEALRRASASASTLWMINACLPDMTGVCLLTILRRRAQRTSVFVVGDAYSADDELAARIAGATAYLCKPATADWLEGRRTFYPSLDVRAGPGFS